MYSTNTPAVGGGGGGGGGGGNNMDQQMQQQQQQGSNQQQSPQQQQNIPQNIRRKPYVRIVEQPASKALRFRYECEGRSAGSIPGVNSTPENKTFPTIEIVGYVGRAVVVVSCVTKDPPYRPHPHNLVGKEGCKKGVCTVEINSETMRAVFSNLGIQCVKKKDIESALRAREEIRVDPFKTGFSHRFQPASIDLNSVRLCFQVFLESDTKGRFTTPLTPVVSDPIYDKKAMSDLVICRLCKCSSTVAGGKEIILLCEKVAKEDISVRFFEEKDGQAVWEAYGDFQHTDVHKQTAINFRTPRYRTLDIEQPVKVYIQLKRPSDGATSEPLRFDYLPLDAGRHSFFTLSKEMGLRAKPDLDIFARILADDKIFRENLAQIQKPLENGSVHTEEMDQATESTPRASIDLDRNQISEDEVINLDTPTNEEPKSFLPDPNEIDRIVSEKMKEVEMELANNLESSKLTAKEKTSEWIQASIFEQNSVDQANGVDTPAVTNQRSVEGDKSLNELFNNLEELEDIYEKHQLRRDTFHNTIANELSSIDNSLPNVDPMDLDDIFDDAATYTSLQRAFKNPVDMMDPMPPTPPLSLHADSTNPDPIETVVNPPAPIIDVSSLGKRDSVTRAEEQQLPPRPPKRSKKLDEPSSPVSSIASPVTTNLSYSENNLVRQGSNRSTTPRPQSSQIIIMKTPDQTPPTKRLPPPPPSDSNSNTLPKQKKPGFFSKLFSRRKSKSDLANENISKKTTPVESREPSVVNSSPQKILLNNRASIRSLHTDSPTKGPKVSKPVGRSVSSVSGKRPHLTADVIHIPLKGDSSNSLPMNERYSNASTITLNNLDRKTVSALQLADIPLQEGNMNLVAIADAQSIKNLCEGEFGVHLDPEVDLTEAEHFALYTSIPPQATASEFDENSCYYAPVDAGEILTPAEVARRLADPIVLKRKRQKFGGEASHLFRHFQAQEQQQLQDPHQTADGRQHMGFLNIAQATAIKAEPRDTSPLPYSMFPNTTTYRMPENSPSPQPLSPPTPLYNLSNTPSPYNMAAAGGNLISPNNQQYGGAGAGSLSPNINVDMNDMGGASYHPQYQQQQQQQPGPSMDPYNHMQQQSHLWNLPPATTTSVMNNLLTTQNTMAGNQPHQQWNLPGSIKQEQLPTASSLATNPFMMGAGGNNPPHGQQHQPQQHQQDHHQHRQQQQQQHQHQHHQPTTSNMNISEAPNISSLLDMDSEQLIQFNSADFSGLSISQ